jgi:site-specific recombinase XerD
MKSVEPDMIDTDLVRSYIVQLGKDKKTNRTISRNLTSLKMFFRYLVLNDKLAKSPVKYLKAPRFQTKLPAFFTKQEMKKLLDLPDTETEDGIRDKTMLELFYSSGLRISELISVQCTDFNFEKKSVFVTGKGNKTREVPLAFETVDWIKKYLKIRKGFCSNHLFVNNKDKPFHRREAYAIIKGYIKQISFKKGYSPHTLRHTFASHLLSEGADLKAIKEMLGHSSLATTQIYTHLTPKNVRDEYIRGHPRGQDNFFENKNEPKK